MTAATHSSHDPLSATDAGERAVARCDALGVPPYSEAADMLFRPYLSSAHRAALEALSAWMAEAGMTVRMDGAANLIGRYEGRERGAPAMTIGSHIDSVRNGGRYDGALGVMLGVEVLAVVQLQGFGTRPAESAVPFRSSAVELTTEK